MRDDRQPLQHEQEGPDPDRPDANRDEGGYGSPSEGGPGGHGDWGEAERQDDGQDSLR